MDHNVRILLAMGVLALAAAGDARQPDRVALRQAVLAAEGARAPKAEDVQVLRRAAGDKDEAIAVAGVRALGRLERPALVDDLVGFIDVKSPLVRAEAASAIGQSVAAAEGEPVERARNILTARLAAEVDQQVRGVVCETLGRLPYRTAEPVRAVEAALLDASLEPRGTLTVRSSTTTSALGTPVAGVTIGFDAQRRDAPLPVLLGALKGLESLIRQNQKIAPPRPETIARLRRVIVTARSSTPGRDAGGADRARVRRLSLQALNAANAADEPTIVAGLDDPDAQVRRLAAQAAGAAPDVEHRDTILARALKDAESMVRLEAVRAYGRELQEEEGCAPIVAATRDANLHVSLAAIDQLGSGCHEAPALTVLEHEVAALDGAGADRWHAAGHALVSLARLSRERAVAALPAFVAHPVGEVRMYAARAAATLDDAATLERLASDWHPNVREAAIAGLEKLKGHDADTIYLAALDSPDYQLVRTAARALAGSPAREKTVPVLLAALTRITAERRDTSRDPRIAILGTLRELGSAADAAALQPYLKDFDPRVAAEAASILAAWTGREYRAETTRFVPAPAPQWSDIAQLEGARARVIMKRVGAFEMLLFPSEAPATVDRFVRLARQGYYDGLTFHRVVPNFVVQGGSPGANEYMGDGPYMRDEVGLRPHTRGAVGISTRGRDTGDAQIFINLVDNPRLDHHYTVFAEVVRGMNVVDGVREGDLIERVEIVTAAKR